MKKKFLVVRYFDTYEEARLLFDTEDEALEFEKNANNELRHQKLTSWEYRGTIDVED